MPIARFPRTLLMAGLAGSLLVLSACGGSSETATPGSTAPAAASGATGDVPADVEAFRSCLADNGVTLGDGGGIPSGMPSGMPSSMPSGMPSGGPGPGGMPGGLPEGVDQETFDAATAACADLAPQGGPGGGARALPDDTALTAYRSCLGDHDVVVGEDPQALAALDRSDPVVAAAMETCAPLLPAGPNPSPTASAGT